MAEHKDTNVSVGKSESREYYVGLAKTFIKYAGENEFVTGHSPKTHPGEPLHSQLNLINSEKNTALKIKFEE